MHIGFVNFLETIWILPTLFTAPGTPGDPHARGWRICLGWVSWGIALVFGSDDDLQDLANEAAPVETEFTLANELAIRPDGWVVVAPYGDHRHEQGTQRLERSDAENLVNEFNRLRNLPQRLLGLPWYIGHPDHPKFASRYPDTKAYGRIKELKAGDEGLLANVKWSAAGEQLIKDEAFAGHSVNWSAVQQGGIWRPVRMKSVGFTNEPNIPTPPVTLANEEIKSMKSIAKRLGLAEDATEQQIIDALEAERSSKRAAETALANEQALKIAAQTEKAASDAAKAAAEAAKAQAETALANERKARIGTAVDAAVLAGRLKPAEKDARIAELANAADLDAKLTELANAKPAFKTRATSADVGSRSAAVSDRSAKVLEFVNEKTAKGLDYDEAWALARKERPELFTEMQEPEAK